MNYIYRKYFPYHFFEVQVLEGSKLTYCIWALKNAFKQFFGVSNYNFPQDMTIENNLGVFCIPKNTDVAGRVTSYFESDLRKYFVIEKDQIFIDVGANAGIYSTLMAKKYPNAEIYSIEPEPFIFKILNKNIALNKVENIVHTFNIGLSDKPRNIHFAVNHNLSAFSYVIDEEHPLKKGFNEITVKGKSLDIFIEENKIDLNKIGLIKVDVEGHEYFTVGKGGINTLKGLKPGARLIVEIISSKKKELLDLFESNHFNTVELNEDNFLFTKR